MNTLPSVLLQQVSNLFIVQSFENGGITPVPSTEFKYHNYKYTKLFASFLLIIGMLLTASIMSEFGFESITPVLLT